MPRQRMRMGQFKPMNVDAAAQSPAPTQPRYMTRETLVERIYTSIISAIESGENVDDVVNRYMPLLLNEVDEMALTFPEVKSLFMESFRAMWDMRFKNIPAPDVDEGESAEAFMAAVLDTLAKNSDKLEVVGGTAKTTHEIRQAIMYSAVRFMEAVCRHFFRMMGVLS